MFKGTRSVYVGHCLCTCSYTEYIVRSKMVKGKRSVTIRKTYLSQQNYLVLEEKIAI